MGKGLDMPQDRVAVVRKLQQHLQQSLKGGNGGEGKAWVTETRRRLS